MLGDMPILAVLENSIHVVRADRWKQQEAKRQTAVERLGLRALGGLTDDGCW
jgi:hypothetical protein